MDTSFHASLKLVTGEEVLAEITPTNENGTDFFVAFNPIIVNEQMQLDHQKGIAVAGLVPKKWMTYAADDMTIIYKNHVVSISEMDKFGVDFYNKALIAAKMSSPIKKKVQSKENVGYVGKTEETRNLLDKIFDDSPELPEGE
jgi:hypothetical protein